MSILLKDALIVDSGRGFHGHLAMEGDSISAVYEDTELPRGHYDDIVDAAGCVVMPGVIDTHVHFREPGLTAKADIRSESRAAAFGGITSYFDMPNTQPQTVGLAQLEDKWRRAAADSMVNYAFFFGATNDNIGLLPSLDPHRIPGIKLFMGSSTGNMLVDKREVLRKWFAEAGMPIMAHCEDTDIINREMTAAVAAYGEDPPVERHPQIRSEEACYASSSLAVELAREYGTQLHIAHLSTARELALLDPCRGDEVPAITGEAVIAHLMFTSDDYARLGTRIKCNPAVKTAHDRDALRRALTDGRIYTVATDHAPHLLAEKEGGCRKAASGMPMVQFSLPCMLELVDEGVLTLPRLVELMCHHPARRFSVSRRGTLTPGYKADVVVVRPHRPWTVTADIIQSRCGWSPLEGHTFNWRVEHTFCNGRHVLDNGRCDDSIRGEAITFRS